MHFIFNHRNPVSGKHREISAKPVHGLHGSLFADKKSHLVTLVVKPDNTFSVKVDAKEIMSGDLGSSDAFDPPVAPSKTVDDPADEKPSDWVDDKMMDDPEASKPDDWVDAAEIEDPAATKPEDWQDEDDGEWEPPTISNPAYKGKWAAPKIENPAYKGVWTPKQIPNPEWFEEANTFAALDGISAVAYELWTTQGGYTFDNVLITDSEQAAEEMAAATWSAKRAIQDAADGNGPWLDWLASSANEMLEAANEQPWIYAVVAMVFFVVIFLACCNETGGEDDGASEGEDEDGAAAETDAKGEKEAEAADEDGEEAKKDQ